MTSHCVINHLSSGNIHIIYDSVCITCVQAESVSAAGEGGDSNDYDQLSIKKIIL